MKKLFYVSLCLALIACQQKKEQSELVTATETIPVREVKRDARKIGPAKSEEQLLIEKAIEKMQDNSDPSVGYWVGMFGKNKINIAIAEIADGKALGYTVCAGNYRPITGTS